MRTDINFSDRRMTDTMQVKMYKTEGRNRMMEREKTVTNSN